eukprot:COSAG05_NODE_21732_length_269_cov_2.358824_1_plen_36_part_10
MVSVTHQKPAPPLPLLYLAHRTPLTFESVKFKFGIL